MIAVTATGLFIALLQMFRSAGQALDAAEDQETTLGYEEGECDQGPNAQE